MYVHYLLGPSLHPGFDTPVYQALGNGILDKTQGRRVLNRTSRLKSFWPLMRPTYNALGQLPIIHLSHWL